jgi:hypothetical protein
VENRVLMEEAKVAVGNEGEGGVLLVAEAAGRGKGIGDEAEVVEEDEGGAVRGLEKVVVDGGDEVGGGQGEGVGKFRVDVGGGFSEENIAKDSRVDGGAGELRKGAESAVIVMATTPEVDRRGIAVVLNEQVEAEVDRREGVVVGGREDKLRAGGEKGKIEAEEVLEGGSDVEGEVRANEGGVGEGAAVEGGDSEADRFLQGRVQVGGKDEEEHVVGEEGDDEGVDEEDFFVEGEAGEDGAVEGEAGEGFGDRGGEHPLKGDLPANHDAEVRTLVGEWQIGPGAGGNEVPDPVVARGWGGGEDEALGLVNTKTGDNSEAVDKGEGG